MKTAVLTHGWGFGDAVWRPLAGILAERGWQVRLAGLPGYDARPACPPDAWPATLSDSVPEGAVWVAWSLGGRLALQALVGGDVRPSALCLIGVGRDFVSANGAGLPPEDFAAFRGGLSEPGRLLRRFAALVAHGDPQMRRVRRALADIEPPPREALAEGLDWLERPLPRPPMHGLPILLLHGRRDALVPEPAVQALEKMLPGARRTTMDAGHAPHLSAPAAVADVLEMLA